MCARCAHICDADGSMGNEWGMRMRNAECAILIPHSLIVLVVQLSQTRLETHTLVVSAGRVKIQTGRWQSRLRFFTPTARHNEARGRRVSGAPRVVGQPSRRGRARRSPSAGTLPRPPSHRAWLRTVRHPPFMVAITGRGYELGKRRAAARSLPHLVFMVSDCSGRTWQRTEKIELVLRGLVGRRLIGTLRNLSWDLPGEKPGKQSPPAGVHSQFAVLRDSS